jgi:nitroimidazol reductase NimA-like FMN-containing flavoprotein (pyridoxamine 5'-phosphate oxidase superfamily)
MAVSPVPITFEPPSRVGALTREETDAFLRQPWNARLGTLSPERTPQIAVVWYEFDPSERVFYVIARARSEYVRNIQENHAVTLHIADDIHLEHTRVVVEGRAEILLGPAVPDADPTLTARVHALAIKYMGEKGPQYGARTMSRPRYLIKITPHRWQTWTGQEWGAKYRNG